ncbi:MAG: creatininase family protein [Gammaproteobacteria bacterium]|jgi:creatinine amidohydrolase
MRSGYWQELKTTEFAGLDPERTIAVFPVAAVEQHGPHLPLATDALINDGIVRAAIAAIPDDIVALFLPALNFGASSEHEDFSGTLSIAAETLLASWLGIAEGVARTGIRKLVILNSHGGQKSLVDLAAIRLRVAWDMLVVRCNYFAFGAPDELFSSEEWTTGLHGGEIETSLMLHLHPELVATGKLDDFGGAVRSMARKNRWLGAEKPVGFGWKAHDLDAAGVAGNARSADAERGAVYLAHISKSFVELLSEVAATPLSVLR